MKKIFTLLLVILGCVGQAMATDYYVAGPNYNTNQSDNGDWVANVAANKMQRIGETTMYQLVVTGKSLVRNTTYYYSITAGDFDHEYKWSNNTTPHFTVHTTGTYTITYKFDSSNNNVYEAEALLTSTNGIYLHSSKYWANNDDYKFSFDSDLGKFKLDVDISDQSSIFYFRFHITEDDNDFGGYLDSGDSESNVALNDGIESSYVIRLNDNKFWKGTDSKDHNFTLPLGTKPCEKLHLELKIVNETATMDMVCYNKVTTNGSGYRTFVNLYYPLQFTNNAYYAEDRNNGCAWAVPLTGDVAIGTPMIIVGDANKDYYFPVASTDGTSPSPNAFKAGTVTTASAPGLASTSVISSTTYYNYILNGNIFKAANGQTVATDKAYLQLSAQASSARVLVFPEDDDTGIDAIMNTSEKSNAYYNLSGQRIANPTKGLYIVNGKKVVIR